MRINYQIRKGDEFQNHSLEIRGKWSSSKRQHARIRATITRRHPKWSMTGYAKAPKKKRPRKSVIEVWMTLATPATLDASKVIAKGLLTVFRNGCESWGLTIRNMKSSTYIPNKKRKCRI